MAFMEQLYHLATVNAVYGWWFWLPALGLDP